SSVFRRGTFFVTSCFLIGRFFISCYLPRVHISSGHRPDKTTTVLGAHRKNHKERPPRAYLPNRYQAILIPRMLWVGRNARAVQKQGLDFGDRYSMLLAFGPVAVIPVESACL
ncbi:MAG: hypothetical protein WBD45_21615, partial [Terriglobales bacterium]